MSKQRGRIRYQDTHNLDLDNLEKLFYTCYTEDYTLHKSHKRSQQKALLHIVSPEM